MGGVTSYDNITPLKSKANFMVGVSLTNSYILYKLSHPNSKMNMKKFQEVLATQLIGEYCSRRIAGKVSHPIQPLPILHFPTKVPTPRGKGAYVRRGTREKTHDGSVWSAESGYYP